MIDSFKGIDWSKLVVTEEMIDYVLAKYENKWEIDDAIADVILDDLLQKTFNEPKLLKDDKGKGILNEAVLYKAEEQMMKEKEATSTSRGTKTQPETTSTSRGTKTYGIRSLEPKQEEVYVVKKPYSLVKVPMSFLGYELQKQKLNVLAERETLKFLAKDRLDR
ncbi:hypothetical protein Tco_1473535 [Tanacetum coccineum]